MYWLLRKGNKTDLISSTQRRRKFQLCPHGRHGRRGPYVVTPLHNDHYLGHAPGQVYFGIAIKSQQEKQTATPPPSILPDSSSSNQFIFHLLFSACHPSLTHNPRHYSILHEPKIEEKIGQQKKCQSTLKSQNMWFCPVREISKTITLASSTWKLITFRAGFDVQRQWW